MYATKAWTTEPNCDVRQVLKDGEAADVGSVFNSSVFQSPDGGLVMAEFYPTTQRWIVFSE